jgi:hypothetical protein
LRPGSAGVAYPLAVTPGRDPRPKRCGPKKDGLLFQRATQTYLWAAPLINTLGIKIGAKKVLATGYNVMPVWTKQPDAKTRVITPNRT